MFLDENGFWSQFVGAMGALMITPSHFGIACTGATINVVAATDAPSFIGIRRRCMKNTHDTKDPVYHANLDWLDKRNTTRGADLKAIENGKSL